MELKSAYENELLAFTGVVGDLVHSNIKTVDLTCKLGQATQLLITPSINYLVILKSNIPIGMVNKEQFTSYRKKNPTSINELVSKIMDTSHHNTLKEDIT